MNPESGQPFATQQNMFTKVSKKSGYTNHAIK